MGRPPPPPHLPSRAIEDTRTAGSGSDVQCGVGLIHWLTDRCDDVLVMANGIWRGDPCSTMHGQSINPHSWELAAAIGKRSESRSFICIADRKRPHPERSANSRQTPMFSSVRGCMRMSSKPNSAFFFTEWFPLTDLNFGAIHHWALG